MKRCVEKDVPDWRTAGPELLEFLANSMDSGLPNSDGELDAVQEERLLFGSRPERAKEVPAIMDSNLEQSTPVLKRPAARRPAAAPAAGTDLEEDLEEVLEEEGDDDVEGEDEGEDALAAEEELPREVDVEVPLPLPQATP